MNKKKNSIIVALMVSAVLLMASGLSVMFFAGKEQKVQKSNHDQQILDELKAETEQFEAAVTALEAKVTVAAKKAADEQARKEKIVEMHKNRAGENDLGNLGNTLSELFTESSNTEKWGIYVKDINQGKYTCLGTKESYPMREWTSVYFMHSLYHYLYNLEMFNFQGYPDDGFRENIKGIMTGSQESYDALLAYLQEQTGVNGIEVINKILTDNEFWGLKDYKLSENMMENQTYLAQYAEILGEMATDIQKLECLADDIPKLFEDLDQKYYDKDRMPVVTDCKSLSTDFEYEEGQYVIGDTAFVTLENGAKYVVCIIAKNVAAENKESAEEMIRTLSENIYNYFALQSKAPADAPEQ